MAPLGLWPERRPIVEALRRYFGGAGHCDAPKRSASAKNPALRRNGDGAESRIMKVSRLQIVLRGLTNRCPNCGDRTLFEPESLFRVNKVCPKCGFQIEREGDEG